MQQSNFDSTSKAVKTILDSSTRAVFFGGAGVSTESGIPDFRSVDGLYNQTYAFPPEEILSHTFFMNKPDEFYRFYRERVLFPSAQPNAAHRFLAHLEHEGKLQALITQNIDGLHQKAGSRVVLELHGSVHRNYCMACSTSYSLEEILAAKDTPRCHCGALIKPDVVLYEEPLDEGILARAVTFVSEADTLIVGGTSLGVFPAAGLVQYFRGEHLILINKEASSLDTQAEVVIHAPIGETCARISEERGIHGKDI